MSRRLLPRDRLGARLPMLALSLVCVVASVVFFATGLPSGAITSLLAAFLLVAVAKRR